MPRRAASAAAATLHAHLCLLCLLTAAAATGGLAGARKGLQTSLKRASLKVNVETDLVNVEPAPVASLCQDDQLRGLHKNEATVAFLLLHMASCSWRANACG